MTEQDYIDLCVQKAIEEAKDVLSNHLRPFDWVEKGFQSRNMTEAEFKTFLQETL